MRHRRPMTTKAMRGGGGGTRVAGSEGAPTTEPAECEKDGSTTTTTKTKATAEEEEEDANVSYDGSDLVAWINDNGGLVHGNARIGLDPTGKFRGVFAKDAKDGGGCEEDGGIEEGDIIVRVPW